MGAHTKTGKFAVGFTTVGFIFVLTAMAAPYWLVTDGGLTNPKFTNLGKCQKLNLFAFITTTPLSYSSLIHICLRLFS